MTKMDFAKAKKDIGEIVEIVKTVPEALQQKCFELLFAEVFKPNPERQEKVEEPAKEKEETKKKADQPADKKLPPNVMAFTRKHGVTQDELNKLFMLDHDPLLPIYKIPSGNVAKGQIMKVMMVLLQNGLLENSLSALYTEVREGAKEDGLYDSNFNKVLKRNEGLFRGLLTKDGIDENGRVELTGAGMEKLAEVIHELAQ